MNAKRSTPLTLDGLVDLEASTDLCTTLQSSPLSLISPNTLRAQTCESPSIKSNNVIDGFSGPRRKARPDPRRQSSAIFAGFAKATAGAGLLADDEIAVGDDDILISLPVASKNQAAGVSHNTLWLEPHTDELLDENLPEPSFPVGHTSALEPILESPTESPAKPLCKSPARSVSPTKCPWKRTDGMRDSRFISEGLSKLCLETGLDDWDAGDFQLQDGNKVKEMAFLFKMASDTKAVSPSGFSQRQTDGEVTDDARTLGNADTSTAVRSVKAEVEKLQMTKQQSFQGTERLDRGSGKTVNNSTKNRTKIAAVPPPRSASSVKPSRLKQPSSSSSYFSNSVGNRRATSAALKPSTQLGSSDGISSPSATAKSKVAAPVVARPRGRQPGGDVHSSRVASISASVSQSPRQVQTRKALSTANQPDGSSSSRSTVEASPARSTAVQRGSALCSMPGRSRLSQSSIPPASPEPSSASKMPPTNIPEPACRMRFNQQTTKAAASRLRPPTAHSSKAPNNSSQTKTTEKPAANSKLPKLRLSSPGIPSPKDSLTPNTARIRFLEQHPELVFGGSSRIDNSPSLQEPPQPVRRKTAEERHLEDWGDHL